MKTKHKSALLAAFDLSPGSAYDAAGALRSLAQAHPEAAHILAAIDATHPLPLLRAIIEALTVDDPPKPPKARAPRAPRAPRKKAS